MANTSILAAFERLWYHVVIALNNKSDISHTHDDRYYTETEIDDTLSPINDKIDGSIKSLSVSGKIITYTKNNGTTGTITTQDTNTDTKVTQTTIPSSASEGSYPLLLAPSGQTATKTTTSYFDSVVTLNPGNNTITANISGNAATATEATKLGSSTVGASSQPIYLNGGTPTKVSAVGTSYGGTGATSVSGARANLDVYSKAEVDGQVATKTQVQIITWEDSD